MNLSENNYWEVFKTGVIPVIIFFLGFLLAVWLSNRKEKKRLKEIKVYFKTLIDLQCDAAILQSDYFLDCASRLKNIGTQDVMMQKVVGLSNASINAIDKQDLYKIFIEGNDTELATKKFHLLISRIEYINVTFDLVKRHDREFQEVVSKMILDWGKYDEATNKNLKRIIGTSNIAKAVKNPDQYIAGLAKIIDPYMYADENKLAFIYTYDNFIRKLIDYFQDPSLRDDPRTKDLLTALIYWDNTYTNLKTKYSDRQISCENAAKDLKESAEAVRSLLSEL